MTTLLSKNCVTMSDLGWYCLACRKYLIEEKEAKAHIKQATHQANWASTSYFALYRCEGIRFLSGVFFCEICDIMIDRYQSLEIHLKGSYHYENKRRAWALFSKNCVITSEIGYYCLPCHADLCKDDDALEHIEDPVHIIKAKACTYLEKHEEDCIRDVKGAYFCEMCNMTIHGLTALKDVKAHVTEMEHLMNKRRYFPSCVKNDRNIWKNYVEELQQQYTYRRQTVTITEI